MLMCRACVSHETASSSSPIVQRLHKKQVRQLNLIESGGYVLVLFGLVDRPPLGLKVDVADGHADPD